MRVRVPSAISFSRSQPHYGFSLASIRNAITFLRICQQTLASCRGGFTSGGLAGSFQLSADRSEGACWYSKLRQARTHSGVRSERGKKTVSKLICLENGINEGESPVCHLFLSLPTPLWVLARLNSECYHVSSDLSTDPCKLPGRLHIWKSRR